MNFAGVVHRILVASGNLAQDPALIECGAAALRRVAVTCWKFRQGNHRAFRLWYRPVGSREYIQ